MEKPSLHMPEPNGRLLINRRMSYVDYLRQYHVHVDGNLVGVLVGEQELDVPLAVGDHDVVVRIDWCRSNVLRVRVLEGRATHLEVRAKARGIYLWAAIFYATFGRSRYLDLRFRDCVFPSVLTPPPEDGPTSNKC
jgi:hypothetical protein